MVYTVSDELFACLAFNSFPILGPRVFTGNPISVPNPNAKFTLNQCIQVETFLLGGKTAERM